MDIQIISSLVLLQKCCSAHSCRYLLEFLSHRVCRCSALGGNTTLFSKVKPIHYLCVKVLPQHYFKVRKTEAQWGRETCSGSTPRKGQSWTGIQVSWAGFVFFLLPCYSSPMYQLEPQSSAPGVPCRPSSHPAILFMCVAVSLVACFPGKPRPLDGDEPSCDRAYRGCISCSEETGKVLWDLRSRGGRMWSRCN